MPGFALCTPPVRSLRHFALAAALLLGLPLPPALGAEAPAASAITAKVGSLPARRGLFTIYPDAATGKLWLEAPAPSADGRIGSYLYIEGLLQGLGSNPVGLDRGQVGETHLVTLRRLGGRLLVEEENTKFRATSHDPEEKKAVRESFATSVLWAGEIAATDGDGRFLVDFTSFVARDAHGLVATLKRAGQGSFSLDAAKSALDLEACLAFPDNLELEALLTFSGTEPGRELATTVPEPGLVSLVQHHSLIRLPDDGYQPRAFDPRAGSYSVRYLDFGVPLDQPIDRRLVVRHRLQKVDPKASRSRVVKPIVYYVDSGAPEPVRSALIEGASWWAKAFEDAGFVDAFRVEILPPGVHPLDVRYNVIQWVHRATRGWSFGGGVIDPRTGEMISGHVTLGSQRVRQDRLIFEGLLGTAKTGSGAADDPIELSLARIRQLAAHEVGHALGFAHNFAASTYASRASVMDYPAPLIGFQASGELDVSQAYAKGVGAWDLQAVRYAYTQFPPGVDEAKELAKIAAEGPARGLLFLTDADARPLGSAHPLAHLWDNGADPVAQLAETLKVRQLALSRFGPGNLHPGQPLALAEEVFATVYLFHRYQLEAAVKVLGGLDYHYAVLGEPDPLARPVEASWQRRALAGVLATLDPQVLRVPASALAVLLPRPAEYTPNPELFAGSTRPAFDALGAAATAADLALAGLLEPARAARLVGQHEVDSTLPDLGEVLDAVAAVASPPTPGDRDAELRWVVASVAVDRLIGLYGAPEASPGVRARVGATLRQLAGRFGKGNGELNQAYGKELAGAIDRFLRDGEGWKPRLPRAAEPPPGMPIGAPAADEGCDFDWEGH